ncbi:hypothetical protein [Haloarchaeobius amylolyticus]|uniref:hypothetical protein n=1 Tax=Haloarchaeobius amylolyticus TaxID=1198296 RepID=UPI002271E534|nr:hypothetical protein [Haloarchaeobius amylolyticus]
MGGSIIALGVAITLSLLRRAIVAKWQWTHNQVRIFLESRIARFQAWRSNLDLYSWGKISFWTISILPLVFVGISISYPNSQVVELFAISKENAFFSNSLLLLVNMIGFVFIILIFVIQNTTQEYNPGLSKEIYRDFYLILIFMGLLLIALYNLSGLYFQWSGVLQSLSYILTFSSFLYLVSLSLVTGHYLDVSNAIGRVEDRINGKVTRDNIYQSSARVPLKDEKFLTELNQDTLLITNTSIRAIENNDHILVITCVQSLENIGTKYLGMLISPVEDNFVRELNDQFQFIIERTGKDYTSQKYLEPLSESLGGLSRSTFRNTENAVQTSLWLQSLWDIFKITYPEMDRTDALGKSIREINRTVVLSLETKTATGHSHYWQYSSYLERIGKWSLANKASMPLRVCLSQFQWHYISMVDSLISEELYFQSHQVEKPLDEILELFSTAWKSNQFDKGLLEAVFFGSESFLTQFRYYGLYSLTPDMAAGLGSITTSPPEEFSTDPREAVGFDNARLESEFIDCCEALVEFLSDMASLFPDTNYHDVYSAYPQMLFIFCNDIQVKFVEKTDLVDGLTSDFLSLMLREIDGARYSRPDSTVRHYFGDFLLIAIFFFQGNDERLSEIFKQVDDFYGKAKSRFGEDDTRWIYKHLKLCGCIAAQFDDLKKTQEILDERLVADFYDIPDYGGQAIRPWHEELGYPTGRGHGIKKLSSSQTWRQLQQVVETEFYEDISTKGAEYHEYLESEAN